MRRPVDLENWQELPDGTQFTVPEVTEILRVSANQVRNAIREGFLWARKLKGEGKGTYRIEKRALDEYLRDCQIASVLYDKKRHFRQANGKPLKHIKPTWLHEPSQQQVRRSRLSNGHSARSSGGACDQGGQR